MRIFTILVAVLVSASAQLGAQITTKQAYPINTAPAAIPNAATGTISDTLPPRIPNSAITPISGKIHAAIGESPTVNAQPAFADATCTDNCGGGCCGNRGLGFSLNGWIDAGFMANTDSPTSVFNGPYNSVDRDEFMLNQLYLVGERVLPCCGVGVGGRIDLMFGSDYNVAESDGFERRQDGTPHWNSGTYGLAFPQLYASVGNEVVSLKIGHFYSILGYESVMAPDNFFYSHSYSYQFASPFTHWGLLSSIKLNDCWSTEIGLTNGTDALDRVSDDLGFLGRIRYDGQCGRWTSLAVHSAKDYNDQSGQLATPDFTNRTRFGWVFGLPINCCWDYAFHGNYGVQSEGNPATGGDSRWYGIDQYLYYKVNRCWKVGTRFEWFRDEQGTRVGLNRLANPNVPPFAGNFYSFTFGLNYKPNANIVVRPELRYDKYDGNSIPVPFDDGNSDNQFLIGMDAIVSF